MERDRKQRMDLSLFEHTSHIIVRMLETNKKLSSESKLYTLHNQIEYNFLE